jgi:hypothetical protein
MGLSFLFNRYQPNELFFEKATISLKTTFKGFISETVINVAMWLKLEKDVYHRLNNVTLLVTISQWRQASKTYTSSTSL